MCRIMGTADIQKFDAIFTLVAYDSLLKCQDTMSGHIYHNIYPHNSSPAPAYAYGVYGKTMFELK